MGQFFVIFVLWLGLSAPATAVPVQIVGGVPMPDFTRITFDNLPALLEGGEILIANPALIDQLGYNPSRTWQAGARATSVMMLGDVAQAFGLERFSLDEIAALQAVRTLDLDQLLLSEFRVLTVNTVADIVESLAYGELSAEAVPLLSEIARQFFGGQVPQLNLAQLVAEFPEFAGLPLDVVNLANYGLTGLPGLEKAAIGTLAGWAGQFVEDIPGLGSVPFSVLPLFFPETAGMASLVDIPFQTVEQQRTRTVTGSDVEGFNVSCRKDCLHIELGDPLRGRQWIGITQSVRGGHGLLAAVNNGQEPTGRLPFGPWGKIALIAVDEQAGRANFGLYLRVCVKTLFFDFGCTPYFIGPIPWLPTQEKALTFVGP